MCFGAVTPPQAPSSSPFQVHYQQPPAQSKGASWQRQLIILLALKERILSDFSAYSWDREPNRISRGFWGRCRKHVRVPSNNGQISVEMADLEWGEAPVSATCNFSCSRAFWKSFICIWNAIPNFHISGTVVFLPTLTELLLFVIWNCLTFCWINNCCPLCPWLLLLCCLVCICVLN